MTPAASFVVHDIEDIYNLIRSHTCSNAGDIGGIMEVRTA